MTIIKIIRGFVVLLSVILIFILFCNLFNISFLSIIYYFKTIDVNSYIKINSWDVNIPILLSIFIIGILLSFIRSLPGDVIFIVIIFISIGNILLTKSNVFIVLILKKHLYVSKDFLNCILIRYDYIYLTLIITMFIFKKYLDKLEKLSNNLCEVIPHIYIFEYIMIYAVFFIVISLIFIIWMYFLLNIIHIRSNNATIGIFLIIISIILFGISLFLYRKDIEIFHNYRKKPN
ncbi:hypothetical protein Metvu_1335 [Methanocaldococcus vulcanius M7]|uniref:Uncharacterized protein n=1 Tax=Methanocaldococcus vulcanius (strain ATCC 700851 / DSM 12094 / M7) TaxID=579137 RepID=C9RHY6_METVM|nr:hypothetical protein [Methanocaldococcus vulcanius]ACX73188.1 hypothetical protein Metvu_1335 [Methanocaldococcus vulcanius M7]